MKPGDSVTTLTGTRSHAVKHASATMVTTVCGIRIHFAAAIYNRGRKKPCARCAVMLETVTEEGESSCRA